LEDIEVYSVGGPAVPLKVVVEATAINICYELLALIE
jgi:hypothetical protein